MILMLNSVKMNVSLMKHLTKKENNWSETQENLNTVLPHNFTTNLTKYNHKPNIKLKAQIEPLYINF